MTNFANLEKLGKAGVKTANFNATYGGKAELSGLDFVHAISGLGDDATSWAMFAYVNLNHDAVSFNKLVVKLTIEAQRSIAGVQLVTCLYVVSFVLMHRSNSVSDMNKSDLAEVLKITPQALYQNKKLNRIIDFTVERVDEWERQISSVVELHFRRG
ncbi:hypothetical protein [Vibrio parahaemolyticus]|uniref:hypothetical protein n=1 Tax=Vibrio parahaemolyticus TaxID=670 RepID=UPI0038914871